MICAGHVYIPMIRNNEIKNALLIIINLANSDRMRQVKIVKQHSKNYTGTITSATR